MSLDEEVALYQFAQGIRSTADPVAYDSQADESEKMSQLVDLNTLVRHLKPTDNDIQQALTDSSLTNADISGGFVKADGLTFDLRRRMNVTEGGNTKWYTLLLYLFKVVYQRHVSLGNPADWRYWDLSNPEVVQNIRARHRAFVEEIYADAGFRSEFTHMAKLWHERTTRWNAKRAEPTPERQTRFPFISYDEVITESMQVLTDKQTHGLNLLRQSLVKALFRRYGLNTEEARRVIFEVMERHLQDTYNTDLFGE